MNKTSILVDKPLNYPEVAKTIEIEDRSAEILQKWEDDAAASINKMYELGWSENYIHGALNAWSEVNKKPMAFEHLLDDSEYLNGYNHGLKTMEETQAKVLEAMNLLSQKLN